eukprot:c8428_g1_i1.p1 GENE.c8428_g1_i1~~c8428_g1_i1.p1  ORF type:complete len:180 (+),score=4.05 c8428_g1_i1:61-600(+)
MGDLVVNPKPKIEPIPPQPMGENKKSYYKLEVGQQRCKIKYVADDQEFQKTLNTLQDNMAVAWVEEKDKKIHYFLFYSNGSKYILSAKHFGIKGFNCTFVRVTRQNFTFEQVKNVNRWRNDAYQIGGNSSTDVHIYENTIVKTEGNAGGSLKIKLSIEKLSDSEVGGTIENPIVVEDDE